MPSLCYDEDDVDSSTNFNNVTFFVMKLIEIINTYNVNYKLCYTKMIMMKLLEALSY